jgi:tRNA-2-methylthio-N6-dimethylallyladenosine synthase
MPAQGRFHLRAFGCQMSRHDAGKIANLLHHEGLRPTGEAEEADLVLIYTCSVREKAEQKLYSELGALSRLKERRPGLVLGVGGCVAQQEGGRLLERFPGLDFAFGPQNLRHVGAMLADARRRRRSARVDYEAQRQARFELPERHPEYEGDSPGRAFVTVMEGCDLFCAFCVVPFTRGREVSRPWRDILDEVRERAAEGAREVTLLGQTVNAYGRPRPGRAPGEVSFAELIRRVAAVRGIERVRFTSPHPIFVTGELVRCYAEVPELCPHLHLPVQSGSDRVLAAMGRRHDRRAYLDVVERMRAARPGLAITTDWIVGFPGETDEDFAATLSLLEEVGFVDSFSFKYSPRPGTAAVRRDLAPVPAERAQARLEALQALQGRLTFAAHRARVGEVTEVLLEGESRRGGGQRSGRCPHNRVVNLSGAGGCRSGALIEARVTAATPHSLLAEPLAARAPIALPLL